jgi:hypothetical protein
MSRSAVLVTCLLLASTTARAQTPAKMSPAELAAAIDRLIDARIAQAGAIAAAAADDADFLRRLSLDLVGRIPRVSEIRKFLEDESSSKRERQVEEMLASNGHVVAMGSYWRKALIPDNNNPNFPFQFPEFKFWVEQRVRDNVAYDKIVHEMLAGPVGPPEVVRSTPTLAGYGNVGTQTFYSANENKPENVASSVTRQFLGVRLECAQCHDHPFASWKKVQFWETAAFFAQLDLGGRRIVRSGKVVESTPARKIREIKVPNTSDVAKAKFVDGTSPNWKDTDESRTVFADWLVARENKLFARHAVNRLWSHFFGVGLAEPIDDETTEENPVSHPELLDLLAKQFVASGFDIKHMIRAMVSTKTYQRSSRQTHPSQADARLWARMPVRGLTGEQTYDSLAVAIGLRTPTADQPFNFGGARFDFLNRFASKERASERQTSILQALMVMNGKISEDGSSLTAGHILPAIAEAPFLSTTEKIETLFLATLSRMPRADEMERLGSYVERGGTNNDRRTAMADVFWVLLNSAEFSANR